MHTMMKLQVRIRRMLKVILKELFAVVACIHDTECHITNTVKKYFGFLTTLQAKKLQASQI